MATSLFGAKTGYYELESHDAFGSADTRFCSVGSVVAVWLQISFSGATYAYIYIIIL